MTVASPAIPIIAQGSARSAGLNGIFDLVQSSSTAVRMKIDDDAGTVLIIPLALLGQTGWVETVCGT